MHFLKTGYCLAMIFFCLGAKSQQLMFSSYTASDGLVANPVSCIFQDSKGFLWVGTFEGLSRYDGHKFISYTTANGLQDNFINSIAEADGRILVAENGGGIDILENSILVKRYKLKSAANRINNINGKWLISTDANGFYEYKNGALVYPGKELRLSTLGNCISYNDSLFLCDEIDKKLVFYRQNLELHSIQDFGNTHFYNLYRDSKKRVWACTSSGLKLLDASLQKHNPITFVDLPAYMRIPILMGGQVTCMQEMLDGSVWLGTSEGLVHLQQNGMYKVYGKADGLPSYLIKTLFKDREDNLWIGTERGLAKWVSKNHINYHYNNNNANQRILWTYPLPGHKVMLSTGQELYQYDLSQNIFSAIPLKDPYVPIERTSPLQLYFSNAIKTYNETSRSLSHYQHIDSSIPFLSKIIKHPGGEILFAGFDGLYIAVGNKVKKILPHRITALEIDSGGMVWAGTWVDGLFRISLNNGAIENYRVENLSSLIPDSKVRSLCIDSSNTVWVGTRHKGVITLVPAVNGMVAQHKFSRQNGLMSDWVKCIAKIPGGDMWIGTNQGVDRLVKKGKDYIVYNFSRKMNFYASIEDMDYLQDKAWLCLTDDGFTSFKDESIHITSPAETIILSATLGINQNNITHVLPREPATLHYKQNAARFEFSALNFINEKEILYSYRLSGSTQENWSNPENIHEASYASIAPGQYSFEVRSVNWDMQPGKIASYSFIIKSPFYKQWWFLLLALACIAAGIYAIYRYRLQQVVKLQQMRNTIATDLHDDIGSALTNISILAELSKHKNQDPGFPLNLPVRITEEALLAQQALDDIIWSVNTNNDNLNQTMARMRRYAAETFEPVGINCRINSMEIPGEIKIHMEQRKDIFLVFKECMHNIIKHANAEHVDIKIEIIKNIFRLTVEDDGKGFDPLLQSHRNGIKNMKSRIRRWNGEIDIQSRTLNGTRIICTFPLASPG